MLVFTFVDPIYKSFPMKHLTILVPNTQMTLSTISCIVGSYDIFSRANKYWIDIGKSPLFKVQLAGNAEHSEVNNGLLMVRPQVDISSIKKTDLIIIPSIAHDFKTITEENSSLMDWVVQQYKHGAEVASMCTGAFLLASSGLLNGRKCSIHWNSVEKLKTMFPEVDVKKDELITDEQGIYTNGGAYSFLNLLMYLVEKYYDRQAAIYCSKIFQVEIDRQNQSAFTIFKGQKCHNDAVIKKAQAYIEDNFSEKILFESLSKKLAVGRRNFDRRFIKATGNTPVEYLQRVKIESAKKAFETTRKNISEVMYEAGYSDLKAFREVFRKITGISPLEYRRKYNKEAAVI